MEGASLIKGNSCFLPREPVFVGSALRPQKALMGLFSLSMVHINKCPCPLSLDYQFAEC